MTDDDRVGVRDVETGDDHAVRVFTFQRPEQRNPIDLATLRELDPLLAAAVDDPRVRAVVLTGQGPAFSAGGDLRGYVTLYEDPAAFRDYLERFAAVCTRLEAADVVTIAMVNGACVAGGLELALACDLMIAADTATIADGHLVFGQLPGAGGSQRLCRAIGLQKAKELLLTGRTIDAAEAAAIGLVAEAVPAADLERRVIEIASAAARHSRLGVRRMKELIVLSQDEDRATALQAEMDLVVDYATSSQDATEGLQAFLERRPPRWQGR
jgi:enoyl-CoA hydratase